MTTGWAGPTPQLKQQPQLHAFQNCWPEGGCGPGSRARPRRTGTRFSGQTYFPSICFKTSKDDWTQFWKEKHNSQVLPFESEEYTQTPKLPPASGLHLPTQRENVRL